MSNFEKLNEIKAKIDNIKVTPIDYNVKIELSNCEYINAIQEVVSDLNSIIECYDGEPLDNEELETAKALTEKLKWLHKDFNNARMEVTRYVNKHQNVKGLIDVDKSIDKTEQIFRQSILKSEMAKEQAEQMDLYYNYFKEFELMRESLRTSEGIYKLMSTVHISDYVNYLKRFDLKPTDSSIDNFNRIIYDAVSLIDGFDIDYSEKLNIMNMFKVDWNKETLVKHDLIKPANNDLTMTIQGDPVEMQILFDFISSNNLNSLKVEA